MGTVRLKDYPDKEILEFTPPAVKQVIRIKIHMIRIFDDKVTALSVVCMTVISSSGGITDYKNSYYISITSMESHSKPMKLGETYYGYLLKFSDYNKEYKADTLDVKRRITAVFEKLNEFDERLPIGFRKGSVSGLGHNGLRIYQKDYFLEIKGGTKMFHHGRNHGWSAGCEVIGFTAEFNEENQYYHLPKKSADEGSYSFLNEIIQVYEKNVLTKDQSPIHIDIVLTEKIIKDLTTTEEINPEKIYKELLYPKGKCLTPPLKPFGMVSKKKEVPKITTKLNISKD